MRYEVDKLEEGKFLVNYIREIEDINGNTFEVFDGNRTIDYEELKQALEQDEKKLSDKDFVKREVEKVVEGAKLQLEDGKRLLAEIEKIK